ncbi:NETI motif-containing protein [Salicibibacter halophilus]|uniref:NETI motif-containing protein n=1 Tax=Salicibibacter halophilus TaxID=2502791 RepID=A0A514LLD6_9BACI|nr:NETI motif-containing protein [Salicibibacter halophilus]QDI92613.1 NETI motif-containing protein [Salicibibacter halophilus]
MGKKVKYEVGEKETIAECLERIARDGYQPVRRVEVPVFREGEVDMEVAKQRVQFEVKKK